MVLLSKIPAALIPRFPLYQALLEPFRSLLHFHIEFPMCLDLNGKELTDKDIRPLPIFATESLDLLMNDVITPLYHNKKFGSLLGGGTPLSICFVKEALPNIEQMYNMEASAAAMKGQRGDPVFENMKVDISELPVLPGELSSLQKEFMDRKKAILYDSAEKYLNMNIMMCKWSDDVMAMVKAQPMVKDGAAKLLFFSAGLDATKDPPLRCKNVYRMRGRADETHLNTFVEGVCVLMSDADTAVCLSGRNQLFHRDAKKCFQALKPKVVFEMC